MSVRLVEIKDEVQRLPARYATEIGRLITRFAYLEYRLKLIGYRLLDLDARYGRVAVREPRAADYVSMLRELVALRHITVSVDLAALQTELAALENFRDRLAHGIWRLHSESGTYSLDVTKGNYISPWGQEKTKARIHPQRVFLTPADIRAKVAAADAVIKKLARLYREVERQRRASLGIRPPPRSPKKNANPRSRS